MKNYMRCVFSSLLITVSFASIGCNSKQDKPVASSSKPVADVVTTQKKAVVPVASTQEEMDVKAAAVIVLAQFTAGDFAAIYKKATPGFKQIGSEVQFVEKFKQTLQKVGKLKNPKEISFETRPDKNHVVVYRLESDHYVSNMRLTFVRAMDGKMELAGLNQHDELKK